MGAPIYRVVDARPDIDARSSRGERDRAMLRTRLGTPTVTIHTHGSEPWR